MGYNEFDGHKRQYEGRDTPDLIREYQQVQAEMKRIDRGQRGVDYYGGYDDSVANDISALEFEISRRAFLEYDKQATDSIMNSSGSVKVSSQYYAYVLHGMMAQVLELLEQGEIDEAKVILRWANPVKEDH